MSLLCLVFGYKLFYGRKLLTPKRHLYIVEVSVTGDAEFARELMTAHIRFISTACLHLSDN
jgi:DNA-binding GntR family transcriptional regulator